MDDDEEDLVVMSEAELAALRRALHAHIGLFASYARRVRGLLRTSLESFSSSSANIGQCHTVFEVVHNAFRKIFFMLIPADASFGSGRRKQLNSSKDRFLAAVNTSHYLDQN